MDFRMRRNLTIQLIAPSGYPHDRVAIRRGVDRLEAAGYRITGKASLDRLDQRFAGTIDERVAELNAFADRAGPLPDIALVVRGGYGAHHLLEHLHYDGLRERLADTPLAMVGHSDFTAIQLALLARSGLITFAGPMLGADFGAEALRDFTWRHFWETLGSAHAQVQWSVEEAAAEVDVQGTLWGGNLAVLCALAGTPYMPQVDGGILFVEDIAEPPFRVERMLYHLHLTGILKRQKALVLGNFSSYRISEYDNGYDLPEAVERIRQVTGIPVVTELPFGHCPDKFTLPVGAPARLTVGGGEAQLSWHDIPFIA
jgi:muramoyltetrapeptide carboxypeptidase